MKWMLYDRKNRVLEFKLEEHEFVDEMVHHIVFEGPKEKDKPEKVTITSGESRVGSQWNLKFKIPEEVKLHTGTWTFIVISEPFQTKGQYITATGFSYGMDLVCHQAITKRL